MESDSKKEQNLSSKNDYLSTFFAHDRYSLYFIKKTEKLVSAIYLVTNFFSDRDPLKWKLREMSSELLSFTIDYKTSHNSINPQFIDETRAKIFSIVSHLEISLYAGLVSQMNFSVIKNEFVNLLDLLNLNKNIEQGKTSVTSAFFEVGLEVSPVENSSRAEESGRVGQPNALQQPDQVKDRTPSIKGQGEKRSGRQNTILALIKKKKEVTIKDISIVIKNCSEKTIQRELIGFMSAGIVRRIGERRWSKYSLI